MRSAEPMPGNPWPHDMVLTINDDVRALFELLWVRAAWGLSPGGDVPPPAEAMPEHGPSVQRLRRDKGEWEHAWTDLWSAVLGHAGTPTRHEQFEAMQAAPLGSLERSDLLDELVGPSWSDRFDDTAFDDAYRRWMRAVIDRTIAEGRLPLDQHPERRCLDALVPAWERGLTTIVVIPCSGDYTRTVGSSALCVTRAARLDPDRYRQALTSFTP